MAYEYKTVAGPDRGKRKSRARRVAERVAEAMEDLIREESAGGWEYVRTDVVPVEERASFLSRRRTVQCPVLVFRRQLGARSEPRPELSQKAARIFASARAEIREAVEPQINVPRAPERRMPPVSAGLPPTSAFPAGAHPDVPAGATPAYPSGPVQAAPSTPAQAPLTLTQETRIDRKPVGEDYPNAFFARRGPGGPEPSEDPERS